MNQPTRRQFLSDVGFGVTGLALGTLLHRDLVAGDGTPHRTPKAKSVLWIVLPGGYSHLETFDPKPALNQYSGKTFSETPYPNPLDSPLHDQRSRSVVPMKRDTYPIIYPLPRHANMVEDHFIAMRNMAAAASW